MIFIVVFLIIINQNFYSQILSETIMLNNKSYELKLNNDSKALIKKDGNIVIDKTEYKYVNVPLNYVYEIGYFVILNYLDYLYIDLGVQSGEYGAEFKVLLNYKTKKIIFQKQFTDDPIMTMIGYKDYIIIICLKKIQVFNLIKEKLQYEEELPYLVSKVSAKDNEVEIIARKNEEIRTILYNDIIVLNNINEYKYYISNVTNLRLRESSDSNSKILRNLTKGEKLELIEKGEEETINGITGNWVKVKTQQGETGWCFDAYLEEVK
jgi:hypothetical protein